MSRYRRLFSGPTYFFTVVAYRRRPIFCDPKLRAALRDAIRTIRETRPFSIDAWVLLPDHMHCIWTLPEGDHGYSIRWAEIKRYVSSWCRDGLRDPKLMTQAARDRRESSIWSAGSGNTRFGTRAILSGTWITSISIRSSMGT